MSVAELSEALGVPDRGVLLLAVVALALAVAAVVRGRAQRGRPDEETARAWRSIGTWWVLFTLLLVVLLVGRSGVLVCMSVASLLVMRETLRLIAAERLMPVAGAVTLVLYVWAWLDPTLVFARVLPVVIGSLAALEAAGRLAGRSGIPGLARSAIRAPRLQYPAAIALIGPSYAFGLASLEPPAHVPESELGWFLLLVMLTELNDMAQAWWGRAVGRRPLAPVLSPKKTWEGLLGGLLTTTLAATVLAPALTSFGHAHPPGLELPLPPWVWSAGVGLVVGLAGISGDLAASALKRAAGVKDSGTLLPGQGGVLDRLDSLSLTAPVFFALTWVLWSAAP